MTITYTRELSNDTVGGFTSLLFKWKGSLYKIIFRELILFLIVFSIIGAFYREVMNQRQKR